LEESAGCDAKSGTNFVQGSRLFRTQIVGVNDWVYKIDGIIVRFRMVKFFLKFDQKKFFFENFWSRGLTLINKN
jgi:hypothetical protein